MRADWFAKFTLLASAWPERITGLVVLISRDCSRNQMFGNTHNRVLTGVAEVLQLLVKPEQAEKWWNIRCRRCKRTWWQSARNFFRYSNFYNCDPRVVYAKSGIHLQSPLMKSTAKSKSKAKSHAHPLAGKHFHTVRDMKVNYQGRVLDYLGDGRFLVSLYEWTAGNEN